MIHFSPPATLVQINAGSGLSNGLVTMEAFDSGGTSLGGTSFALQSTLQTLRITANGIARVVITVPVDSASALDR